MLYWTRSDKFDFFSSEERVECLREYTFLGKTTLQRKGKTLSTSLVGLAFCNLKRKLKTSWKYCNVIVSKFNQVLEVLKHWIFKEKYNWKREKAIYKAFKRTKQKIERQNKWLNYKSKILKLTKNKVKF